MITDVRMLESEDGNAFSTVVNWDQDPLTFWTRNKKHNAPNLQHQKHPSLSEEDKASKFIFGGEKFRFEAGRLVRCSLASFVALHKRRRGEERFIVMIFCCTALDTVVGINLGAVMNIMWRWTKCNSSTQESDASEYQTSHVASEQKSVENNNCVYLTVPAGPWPGIVKVFFFSWNQLPDLFHHSKDLHLNGSPSSSSYYQHQRFHIKHYFILWKFNLFVC